MADGQKRYRWNAEDYALHSSAQYGWAQELIRNLELNGSEWILDLGCGDGRAAGYLASFVPRGRVIGIDRDWRMVSQASQQAGPVEGHSPRFVQMDALRLGFPPVFDLVFSNAVLHWVHDHGPVLAGIRRSLRLGGACLLQMGGAGNASQMIAALDEVRSQPGWRTYFSGFVFPYQFYTGHDYEPLLAQAGLKVHRVDMIPKDMQHGGPEGLAGWLRTAWLPYVDRIPPEQRARFIDSVVQVYLDAYPPDGDGIVHVPMVRLEVAAGRD